MTRLNKNMKYLEDIDWTSEKVKEEVQDGLNILKGVEEPLVTFFGSHLLPESDESYRNAKSAAKEFAKKGYAVASGGGPGIMRAANAGAFEEGAPSLAFRAGLLEGEDVDDDVYTEIYSFHFMFVRRFVLALKSEALIFYTGGYGTLNELFEYAVLMQTGMMDPVPIICVGREYWHGLFDWIRNNLVKYNLLTNHIDDLKILHVVDSFEEVMEIVED